MMRRAFLVLILGVVAFGTVACSRLSLEARQETALNVIRSGDFQAAIEPSENFNLYVAFRGQGRQTIPVIYIEGDGLAWIDRRTISSNPTPLNPLALRLAEQDRSETVYYMARPCQYISFEAQSICHKKYWTKARFSEAVIASYDQILSRLKQEYQYQGFHLVGFSGGGAVATLLAERRTDIVSLRTVAGNIDHVALSREKHVSVLSESLNPMSQLEKLKTVPQIHYSGGKDTVVPSWMAEKIVAKQAGTSCARQVILPTASHMEGWVPHWSKLSQEMPNC